MRKLMTTVTSLGLAALACPALGGPVMSLGLARIVTRTTVEKVHPDVKYVFNRDMGPGRMKKTDDGHDGEVKKVVHEIWIGDKKIGAGKATIERKDARPILYEMGRSGFETSRGAFSRSKVLNMVATAYLPTDGSRTGRTATGRQARFGVVAVDPRVIPLHSLLYVEGYGFAVAADTGGAIKGNRIDVCLHDRSSVSRWGRRRVTVHVFRERVGRGE